MPIRYTIQYMQQIAHERGGKCLSEEYVSQETLLAWMCAKGHTWDATYSIIMQGGWCVQCLKGQKRKEERLEEMKAIAKERGGKLISETYIDTFHKLEWECKEGHRWMAQPGAVKNGKSWCARCAGLAKHTLEEMVIVAEKRGGKCLSENYINGRTKLKWECAEGHQWLAPGNNVVHGIWCRICHNKKNGENNRGNLETFKQIAIKQGGKCLSEKYIDSQTKLQFQCANNHQWMATPNSITNGHWCAICRHKEGSTKRRKLDTEYFRNIATEHGGLLLSDLYIDFNAKLHWQCKEGHQWFATAHSVRHEKTWCPECFNKKRVKNLGALAKKRLNSTSN